MEPDHYFPYFEVLNCEANRPRFEKCACGVCVCRVSVCGSRLLVKYISRCDMESRLSKFPRDVNYDSVALPIY